MTNRSITRREALALTAVCMTTLPTLGCTRDEYHAAGEGDQAHNATSTDDRSDTKNGDQMRVHYLEIVTNDVEAACGLYSEIHGITFGSVDESLGGARTAQMKEGSMIGVRAPMHGGEKTVTRAYMLVDDIDAAVAAAKKSGAEIAVPPMKIPGHGTCAIYFLGGIEAGLWQL